jgi:dihydropteroate synthase
MPYPYEEDEIAASEMPQKCYNGFLMATSVSKSEIRQWREQKERDSSGSTRCGKANFKWGERTYVMGIINMSPDSFSGDGLNNIEQALAHALRFCDDGVDILDIGGESTRPTSQPIGTKEDIERVIPALKLIRDKTDVPISVDTYKYEVAKLALDAGADMINDIWALKKDAALAKLAAESKIPLILMSNQREHAEKNIMPAVITDLKRAIDAALDAGVSWDNIIVDPGIGFGKTLEQNYELIRRLAVLKILGRPILLGTSRKSMIGLTLNLPENERFEGTAASSSIGIANGADIIRVHDVLQMIRVARMSDAIVRVKRK